ncbi:MAG: hypothetical protein ACYC1B_08880 [Thermoleophilia bacterium]
MDLQHYVQQRIDELENIQESRDPADDSSPLDGREERRRFEPETNFKDFCEMIDAALVDIAGRVMDIAENMTEHNARLEKELMDARLEALESAESVMDMTLSIRRKARGFIAAGHPGFPAGQEPDKKDFAKKCEKVDAVLSAVADSRQPEAGARVSMHEVGVAALFRKTR